MKNYLKSKSRQDFINNQSNKGFTLNEMIFAIFITAIIPAITLPFLLNYYNPNDIRLVEQIYREY
jgi:prepilin-type N-terminal cleavage/methylation domain-containing protein